MKEKDFDVYEGLYEDIYDKAHAYEAAYGEADLEERLAYIQFALENACELLEKLVDCALEERKVKEDKRGKSQFRVGKIGADIGEEKRQRDSIARIFGNV